MMLKLIGWIFVFHLFAAMPCPGFAEAGHRIVGGIADRLLVGKRAETAIRALLGPVSLERASTFPDELRGEDKARGTFKIPENLALEAEMLAFRKANPPSGDEQNHLPPSHHWFHYTDVPLQAASYSATVAGTSEWDIVHMISYCQRVLSGAEPAANERCITPAVALVLLTHLLGDLHQPLHVAAAFLDEAGNPADPNIDPWALPDRGGNDIRFGAGNLHSYWDFDTVESALTYQRRIQKLTPATLTPHDWAIQLASTEPAGWRPDPAQPIAKWPEIWADEMLPIAREAHARLQIFPQEIFEERYRKPVLAWTAIEKPHPGTSGYAVFASKTVEIGLHRAGWRLAAMLEAAFPEK